MRYFDYIVMHSQDGNPIRASNIILSTNSILSEAGYTTCTNQWLNDAFFDHYDPFEYISEKTRVIVFVHTAVHPTAELRSARWIYQKRERLYNHCPRYVLCLLQLDYESVGKDFKEFYFDCFLPAGALDKAKNSELFAVVSEAAVDTTAKLISLVVSRLTLEQALECEKQHLDDQKNNPEGPWVIPKFKLGDEIPRFRRHLAKLESDHNLKRNALMKRELVNARNVDQEVNEI